MQKKLFFSDFKDDNKNKNLEPSLKSNIAPASITTLLNKFTNIGINFNNFFKQLYDLCIESNSKKIVKYKKMILINCKLKKIYIDFWKSHNLSLLLRKIYISLFLMNSNINHGSYSSRVKISFLISSNSSCYALKFIRTDLDAYEQR